MPSKLRSRNRGIFADKLPSSQLHAFLEQLDGILHVIGASLAFTLPQLNSPKRWQQRHLEG